MRHLLRAAQIGILTVLSTGCAVVPAPQVTRSSPPNPQPGACYIREVTPATVQTATRQVQVTPPVYGNAGQITQAASYRTEVRQKIVDQRRQIWFETPCHADLTPDFVASLQRALIARGLLNGAPTGMLDAQTRAAIRAFQAGSGPNSAELSMDSARRLGLVAMARGG